MESPEEFVASNDQTQIIKRKRTKRQRSSSPFGLAGAMTSSSSSGCGGIGGGRGGGEREVVEDYGSASSPTTSGGEIYESTEEEEDMANCLIMLAQGEGPRQVEHNEKVVESRKFSFLANNTTTTNKAGFFVYECKTCNRSFPSFQALGGHRASHKKPKVTSEEKKVPLKEDFEDGQFMNTNTPPPPPPLSLQVSSNNKVCQSTNKAKIHECSICGAEFTSGQALGGHMRRHRAATTTTTSNQVGICIDTSTTIESHNDGIKPRNILALDLNLPAPEDDHRGGDTKFQFASTQPPPLVFSAPALVDCHY